MNIRHFLFRVFFIWLILLLVQGLTAAHAAVNQLKVEGIRNFRGEGLHNGLDLNLQTKEISSGFDSFVSARGRYFIENQNYAYSLPEAYISYDNKRSQLAVGRKLVDWSDADKLWLEGQINNLQRMDLLSDAQEGLPGLHLAHRRKSWGMQVFASGLYVPEMNPGYEVSDGQVTSKSYWGSLPPKVAETGGVQVPIHYDLNTPATNEIISQFSAGLQLENKWKSGKASFFALYKPENNLRISGEAGFNPYSQNQNILVNVKPFVNHQRIVGASLQQKADDLQMTVELKRIDPEDGPESPSIGEYLNLSQQYEKKDIASTIFKLTKDIFDFTVGYTHLLSKDVRGGEDFYGNTLKWQRSVAMKLRYFFNDQFNITSAAFHDLELSDSILKQEVAYAFQKGVVVSLGVEMIKANNEESYWSDFKANDLVYSNIGYRF